MVCHDQRLAFGCGVGTSVCLALAAVVDHLAVLQEEDRQFRPRMDDANGAELRISGGPRIAVASPYVDFAGHLAKTWRWHSPPLGLSPALLNSRRTSPQFGWIRIESLRRFRKLRRDWNLVVRTCDKRGTVDGICYNSPSDPILDALGLCGMGQD